MNATEAAKLLAILSAIDRRELDATTAQGWAWALDDVPLGLALTAAKRAQQHGHYVDVQAIQREITGMRQHIESDIRAAKARKLIPDTWPKTQPLPDDVATNLAEARKSLYEQNNDYPDEIQNDGNWGEIL